MGRDHKLGPLTAYRSLIGEEEGDIIPSIQRGSIITDAEERLGRAEIGCNMPVLGVTKLPHSTWQI